MTDKPTDSEVRINPAAEARMPVGYILKWPPAWGAPPDGWDWIDADDPEVAGLIMKMRSR